MKKALLFLSIFSIILMVSCTSKTAEKVQQPIADTTGLSAFQEWKYQHELKEASAYMQEQNTVVAQPAPVVKKKPAVKKPKPVVTTPAPEQTEEDNSTVNETPAQDESGSMNTETTNEAKKKGISNTAKGTVIGAVSGAVLGAVINKKNRVVGGILGGVLGGGVGFGIGKKIDKNQGR